MLYTTVDNTNVESVLLVPFPVQTRLGGDLYLRLRGKQRGVGYASRLTFGDGHGGRFGHSDDVGERWWHYRTREIEGISRADRAASRYRFGDAADAVARCTHRR